MVNTHPLIGHSCSEVVLDQMAMDGGDSLIFNFENVVPVSSD